MPTHKLNKIFIENIENAGIVEKSLFTFKGKLKKSKEFMYVKIDTNRRLCLFLDKAVYVVWKIFCLNILVKLGKRVRNFSALFSIYFSYNIEPI